MSKHVLNADAGNAKAVKQRQQAEAAAGARRGEATTSQSGEGVGGMVPDSKATWVWACPGTHASGPSSIQLANAS